MIAVGYHQMNTQRQRIYNECKAKGYKLATYIHPSVTYFDSNKVGDGCVILDHVTIQPGASVGDNTFLWSNSLVAHCWVAAGATLAGNTFIKDNCFLGVNTTVGHNVTLGESTFVGANT
ncbi:MAG: acetyltransferase-like isoleucine patch superfamily enzyme [Colwellia sp.]|jgi:acetyltransferase-like isoleucine patch superfamily enzyme